MNKEEVFDAVLEWGSSDVEALNNWLDLAEAWQLDLYDVVQFIEDLGLNKYDINEWFYAVLSLIHDEVLNYVDDRLSKDDEDYEMLMSKIRQLGDKFDPYINYLDSSFNDLLDEVNLEDQKIAFEQIIQKLKEGDE